MAEKKGGSSPGPSTDATNTPVIDPTANVRELVTAETRRQDDIATLRAYYSEREADLRAGFQRELDAKEAARIDANRAQDQDTARRNAESALTAVQALAVQAPIQADAVRAAAAASLNPVLERLTNIERVQYEQAGQKQQVGENRAGSGQIWLIVGVVVAALVGLGSFLLAAASLIFVIVRG